MPGRSFGSLARRKTLNEKKTNKTNQNMYKKNISEDCDCGDNRSDLEHLSL
jgi:hypothetical protein